MNYETRRRIKVFSSILGFCVVFLAVVVLVRYGFLQIKSKEKIQSANDFTPLNVSEMNQERKNNLEDALRN